MFTNYTWQWHKQVRRSNISRSLFWLYLRSVAEQLQLFIVQSPKVVPMTVAVLLGVEMDFTLCQHMSFCAKIVKIWKQFYGIDNAQNFRTKVDRWTSLLKVRTVLPLPASYELLCCIAPYVFLLLGPVRQELVQWLHSYPGYHSKPWALHPLKLVKIFFRTFAINKMAIYHGLPWVSAQNNSACRQIVKSKLSFIHSIILVIQIVDKGTIKRT